MESPKRKLRILWRLFVDGRCYLVTDTKARAMKAKKRYKSHDTFIFCECQEVDRHGYIYRCSVGSTRKEAISHLTLS